MTGQRLLSWVSIRTKREVEEVGLAKRVIGRREGDIAVGGAAQDRRADVEDVVDATIQPDLVGDIVAERQIEIVEVGNDGVGQGGE